MLKAVFCFVSVLVTLTAEAATLDEVCAQRAAKLSEIYRLYSKLGPPPPAEIDVIVDEMLISHVDGELDQIEKNMPGYTLWARYMVLKGWSQGITPQNLKRVAYQDCKRTFAHLE